jgi:glycosyltransferase involved in cell wall biosynthesis
MRILVIVNSEGAVDYHRLLSTHTMLKMNYPNVKIDTILGQQDLLKFKFGLYDLILFSRNLRWSNIESFTNRLREITTAKLVLDIDDYWQLDKHHISYSEDYNKKLKESTEESIKYFDYIITTHERLKEKIEEINKNVFIIPNVINTYELQWKQAPKRKGVVKFGFMGGITHYEDLEFANCDFSKLKSIAYLTMYRDLGFQINKGKGIKSYGTLLNDFDVSLAPLLPTFFNSCKSNLKVVEAGVKGKAIVCTETPPYLDFKSENIIYVKPNESWQDTLELLSKDRATVEQLGKGLREEVLEYYNPNKWAKFRMDLYQSIL